MHSTGVFPVKPNNSPHENRHGGSRQEEKLNTVATGLSLCVGRRRGFRDGDAFKKCRFDSILFGVQDVENDAVMVKQGDGW